MTSCHILYSLLLLMETIQENQKITYTLKEKFLLVWPEQRINRSRFFTRSVILGLWVFLLWIIISFLIAFVLALWGMETAMITMIVTVVSVLLQSILGFHFFPILIVKRCYDFDNNGSHYTVSYKLIVIASLVVTLASVFMTSSSIPFGDINTWLIVLSGILQLYLLFKPWMKWDNQYWPDDSNVKTWFLC